MENTSRYFHPASTVQSSTDSNGVLGAVVEGQAGFVCQAPGQGPGRPQGRAEGWSGPDREGSLDAGVGLDGNMPWVELGPRLGGC